MIAPSKKFAVPCFMILLILMVSCKQIDVYEKNTPVPHYKWQQNFPAKGSFTITDTNATYNIYIVIRHTDTYQYNNIWLNVGLQAPGDTMSFQNVNLELATDAGGWQGSGMNDIWEVRKLVSRRILKKGDYHFTITHIMRDNPLPGIMSAGLRLKKAM